MYLVPNKLFVTLWKLLMVLSESHMEGVKADNIKRLVSLTLKNMTKARQIKLR